jgi:glyceraldehyde-3-phosphate dehydrogenase (NADP+)
MSDSASAGLFDELFYDESTSAHKVPFVACEHSLIDGVLVKESDVVDVLSPIRRKGRVGGDDRIKIGTYALCSSETALRAVQAASAAYDHGRGEWPQMTPRQRIDVVAQFATELSAARDEIATILMWEICKNKAAAYKEVDRTVVYMQDTIKELKRLENSSSQFVADSGVLAQVKRSPLGIVLCAAPYNYPLNETFTTLVPALIMGNCVVLKTPRTGGLSHVATLRMYQKLFPKGVINVVHGSGRDVFTPIMQSGLVNVLAFIGSHKAANALHQAHPRPFTVRLALGLDAKNPAIVMPSADLEVATTEAVLGALSFCGQRCTAIKIIFVHESIADAYAAKLAAKVDKLSFGLPFDGSEITPLAEADKPAYLRRVIADAVAKGAKVINKRGCQEDRSLVFPTVLFPVTLDMTVAQEEQFGPVVPIVRFSAVAEVQRYLAATQFGQQAAIFTTQSADLPALIDFLAHQVTRININSQCQRGPDQLPFSGRKVSATGTLSVTDALRAMSIRVAVAANQNDANVKLVQAVLQTGDSNVLRAELLI